MALDFNNSAAGADAVLDLTAFDQRDRFSYGAAAGPAPSAHPSPSASSNVISVSRNWHLPLDMVSPSSYSTDDQPSAGSPSLQSASPLSQHSPFQPSAIPIADWSLQQAQDQAQHQHQAQHQQAQHQHMSHHHAQQNHQHQAQHQHQMAAQGLSQFIQDSALLGFGPFPASFHPGPFDYLPATTAQATLQEAAAIQASFPLESPFGAISPVEEVQQQHQQQQQPQATPPTATRLQQTWSHGLGMESWHDIQATLNHHHHHHHHDGMPHLESLGSHSPTGSYLEVLSIPGSAGEGWNMIDFGQNFDFSPHHHHPAHAPNAAIFNPGQTLHLRSNSDSSDGSLDFGSSFEEISPFHYSPPFSPSDSDHGRDGHRHRHCFGAESSHGHNTGSPPHQHQYHPHNAQQQQQQPSQSLVSPSAVVSPVDIKGISIISNVGSSTGGGSSSSSVVGLSGSSGPGRSGSGSGANSPLSVTSPVRRVPGPRKSPIAKSAKSATIVRRAAVVGRDAAGQKKVGRRRGPLLPEQRKQASEIRKLRACLRCKFLKKTCDKGEPCAGCQPSHARLWQVPCTRIDIKDIAYFMKDWRGDYERHMRRGVSVYNVKGFSEKETLMWITHGYGYALPVMVREVYVADDSCFSVDWVESSNSDEPIDYHVKTEKLDVGRDGVSLEALSEYLDKHIDGQFEDFVDDHFDGTPFITEILKTAHRYYTKDGSSVIRKALKLVVAYNLTLHITMVENHGAEDELEGCIDDEYSRYHGKIVAPVMVNFQIKCAMADMWRELQRDILEELSSLYSSVYSGERLKNWPTIFMLASILLAVWEEMQFDCHYRVPDPIVVNKFCSDMETTPVGVIAGLFHAISQKLPSFFEWNTADHGHILNNNVAVCEAMTEVRQHVTKHETYLRTRSESKFDRADFDSLSNKFLSKLVIRAN